ncbi:hypothetical protein HY949_02775 [Candidatus Gottesmanbacteria bacterium]|nr:hypothetical protein [Candidatus Gottesmanbacteria bacterium]
MFNALLEEDKKLPVFNNTGLYKIIDGSTGSVENGKYSVDTRPASQSDDTLEWESYLHLRPNDKVAILDEDVPNAYTPVGEVLKLWG